MIGCLGGLLLILAHLGERLNDRGSAEGGMRILRHFFRDEFPQHIKPARFFQRFRDHDTVRDFLHRSPRTLRPRDAFQHVRGIFGCHSGIHG